VAKKRSSRKLNVYSNLSHRRKTKKDAAARKKAEYLASLPKHPVKRTLYRMHPKRFWGYWFSKRGAITALKITGVFILFCFLLVGGLFAYYRKDLDAIRPGELAKNVQTTVTRYYDRNGILLWEDKGDGNYKLVVESGDINDYMKKASVAIEDKDFYHHHGVSVTGTLRAAVNNAMGGDVQGGSTLTQQLVKQVFFSDDTQDRGLGGVPRKIKEAILAIEVERMYNKDQILTLYLNESPYGGRRNGVESGAQTYFGKHAKDLTLPQAALLAAIPQNPSLYNPYNVAGNKALVARQHQVLDNMADQKMITQEEADKAKAVPILDTLKPEGAQYHNIKAPHFVLAVKSQLEKEFGLKTMRQGGLTIKTTLDYKAQKYAEAAVRDGAKLMSGTGSDNISLSSVDTKTGQIIAMVGSVDYNKPVYGEQNAATSLLEPGSSIKPVAEYATLFKQREGVNYGPGSILADTNFDSVYCAGSFSGCSLGNYTRRYYGNVTIRQALANSLNIPAAKAMYISGIKESVQTAHDLGDLSFCQGNPNPTLSASIGGGCAVRQVEHTNAYATFARGGVYKPLSYVLEVKNSSGEVLKSWKDEEKKQAVDPQIAYMITDILKDANARNLVFGSLGRSIGFVIPGVTTATKTGTTNVGNSAKDSWMMSYSPVISTGVWNGNHNGSVLLSDTHLIPQTVIGEYMENVHKHVYGPQGKWKEGMDFKRPAGLQTLTVNGHTDIWPSWYKKGQGQSMTNVTFDKVSKKKATKCTPGLARVELTVTKLKDPITKRDTYLAPNGYDAKHDDDVHKCGDAQPSISISQSGQKLAVDVSNGRFSLKTVEIKADGKTISTRSVGGSGGSFTIDIPASVSDGASLTATVIDTAYYTSQSNVVTYSNPSGNSGGNGGGNGNH
jgi:penicillin-binding protein 1A